MADEDDADDDEKGISSSKYPCMPSLVALQQMRNRLHLAHLGKKLMKWTAQATVRELRRLGHELIIQYEYFKEEIAEAFILLARCRYYRSMLNLNKIVLENVPNTACLHIGTTTRSVSGVRLYVLEVIETEEDPYSCLGVERGGQTVIETKKAWRDLLKKMIYIAELRKGFVDIDYANKTANKRMTMMKKIVIPRIKATIEYILFGLEEMAREDIYRLKMVQQHKKKVQAKVMEDRNKSLKAADDDKISLVKPEREVQSPRTYSPTPSLLRSSPMKIKIPLVDQKPSKVISWNDKPIWIKKLEPEPEPEPVLKPPKLPAVCDQSDKICLAEPKKQVQSPVRKKSPTPSYLRSSPMKIRVPLVDQKASKVISWNKKPIWIKEPESKPEPEPVRKPPRLPAVCDQCKATKVMLDQWKAAQGMLNQPKAMKVRPDLSPDTTDTKDTLDQSSDEKITLVQSSDSKVTLLKERLNDIIAQSKEFLETGVKSVNVGQFLKACESVKLQIEDFFKNNSPDKNIKVKLDNLKNNLHDVIGLTKEEFEQNTQTFEETRMAKDLEIHDKMSAEDLDKPVTQETKFEDLDEPLVTQETKSKLVNLKNEIDYVVKMTANLKGNGLLAPSVDKFLNTCSSVKTKIDEYTHTAGDSNLDKLEHLSWHVSGLEEIATDVKLDGLSSCVIESFLVSLKEFQSKLDEYKKREINSPDEGLRKLFTQLDGAIELTREAKEGGLLSDSVEKFIAQCEQMKNKLIKPPTQIEGYNDDYDINDTMKKVLNYLTGGKLTDSTENVIKYLEQLAQHENISPTNSKGEIIYPGCSLSCICSSKRMSPKLCTVSPKSSKDDNADKSCCQKAMSCITMNNKSKDFDEAEKEVRYMSGSWFNPGGSNVPSDTRSNMNNDNEQPKSLYTKIKKITKTTRIQGADGTVSEETETITIRKEEIDSTDSSFDGGVEYKLSDDALKDNKSVGVCVTPDFAQRGFWRQTKSEYCFRTVPLYNTGFWPCTSVEDFRYFKE